MADKVKARFFTLTGDALKRYNRGLDNIDKVAGKVAGVRLESDKGVALTVSMFWVHLRPEANVTEEHFEKQVRADILERSGAKVAVVKPQLSRIFKLIREGGPVAEAEVARWADGDYRKGDSLQGSYKREFPPQKREKEAPKLEDIVAGVLAGEYTVKAIADAVKAAEKAKLEAEQEEAEEAEQEEEKQEERKTA